MDLFFRGSHTTNFVTCGFNKSYNQAAEVPSSKVTCTSPRSPSINCRIMLAFVSITHSITIFPEAFMTAIEMLSLCTSMPIYFGASHKGRSFLEGLSRTLKTLLQKGRPFKLRRLTGKVPFGRLNFSGFPVNQDLALFSVKYIILFQGPKVVRHPRLVVASEWPPV